MRRVDGWCRAHSGTDARHAWPFATAQKAAFEVAGQLDSTSSPQEPRILDREHFGNASFLETPCQCARFAKRDIESGHDLLRGNERMGRKKRIADILEEAPIPARYYLTSQYLDTLKRHKAHHDLLGHGFGYRIKEWDGIASTLSCGGMGRERNLLVDDRQHETEYKTTRASKMNGEHVRQMTPREWARLQGFDDSFILPEGNSYMYKQLGNTVTVPVIEAIATKIKSVLTGYYNGYGVLNQVICSAILYELETAEKSRRELLEVVGYLFPTTYSEENKLARLSSALQALKRRGEILSTGKTRSSVWHLNRNRPEKLLDAELKHFEMLTFDVKPASREERLVGVI